MSVNFQNLENSIGNKYHLGKYLSNYLRARAREFSLVLVLIINLSTSFLYNLPSGWVGLGSFWCKFFVKLRTFSLYENRDNKVTNYSMSGLFLKSGSSSV